jgi:hypothetical protein
MWRTDEKMPLIGVHIGHLLRPSDQPVYLRYQADYLALPWLFAKRSEASSRCAACFLPKDVTLISIDRRADLPFAPG